MMSNNNNSQFSDEELLTIFIYGVMKKRKEPLLCHSILAAHLSKLADGSIFNQIAHLLKGGEVYADKAYMMIHETIS